MKYKVFFRDFFFDPMPASRLAMLRITLSLVLLVQAFLIQRYIMDLYSSEGILQGTLNAYFLGPEVPTFDWITNFIARVFSLPEVKNGLVVKFFFLMYMVALCFLALGFYGKIASILVWFLHTLIMTSSGAASSYGTDSFAHMILFYFIWLPVHGDYSIDRYLHRVSNEATSENRIGLRIMQLHLSLAYFATGFEKALGEQWWNGEAIWRAMMLPEYAQIDISWIAFYPFIPKILGWGTLVIECFYPCFIWHYKTRNLWLLLTVSLHLGIFIFLGLHTFALTMIALNVSLFASVPRVEQSRYRAVRAKFEPNVMRQIKILD